MAGWSMLTNGCALDCSDIRKGCKVNKGNPSCSQADNALKDGNEECEVKLRSLFDQVLSIFSNEAVALGCIRPMPVLVCNGQSLDLFKLFQVVIKRGGFDLVNGFWIFVVKELGLNLEASTAVKLVYYKYLYGLERWLRGIGSDGRLRNELCQTSGNFSCLSLELETEFRSLLSYENGKKKSGKKHKKISKSMPTVKCTIDTKDANGHSPGPVVVNIHSNDDDEKFHDCKKNYSNDDDDDVMILDPSIGRERFNSRKRKRESLLGMLNWVIQIAKCPNDVTIGEVPPFSKWKDHKGDELWAQAIKARDALLQRKVVCSSSERYLFQNKQKLHPSMYEDVTPLVDQSTDRLRCSGRLSALEKPRSCSCCNSCPSSQGQLINSPKKKLEISPKKKLEISHKEQPLVANDISAENTGHAESGDEIVRAHVLVGRRFQAEVPKWNGMVYESDSKWLGTRMWPLENNDNNAAVEAKYIGKGRPNTCDCQLSGSVECVRFHIAENRMKLKLELGPAFYRWSFDRMGEEISLRWTPEEENKFKDMVRLNCLSLGTGFWDDSRRYFPRKTREELVSYYFNVFLVQRRSYQNRVTPKHVDSDDDESELGSLSDIYGHRAVKFPGSDVLICSENKQCTDF